MARDPQLLPLLRHELHGHHSKAGADQLLRGEHRALVGVSAAEQVRHGEREAAAGHGDQQGHDEHRRTRRGGARGGPDSAHRDRVFACVTFPCFLDAVASFRGVNRRRGGRRACLPGRTRTSRAFFRLVDRD